MNKEITLDTHSVYDHAHPFIFLILVLPFGILSGYVTVTYAYLYSKAGVSVEAVAALVGASILPQVLRFLWSPLVDTTFSLKGWYVASCLLTALAIFATGVIPVKQSSLELLTILVIVSNVTVSFLNIAATGLAAHDTPDHLRGTVSGYFQAGNLGGAGIGGGAGLWLAQYFSSVWIPAVALALACIVCCFALYFVKEQPSSIRGPGLIHTWKNTFLDIWDTLKARMGLLAMLLCFIPLGTGAASNLWAAISGEWHASANTVAFVTGVVSGFITATGCLIGGWLCDRFDRRIAYVAFGLSEAVCAVLMAYTPHNELLYIIWTSIYAFTLGLCYAAFNAFVLEAIGKGAAATKFTVCASISNAPIYAMTLVDGWAYAHHGPIGMLNTEALFAVLASVLFIVLLKVLGEPVGFGTKTSAS